MKKEVEFRMWDNHLSRWVADVLKDKKYLNEVFDDLYDEQEFYMPYAYSLGFSSGGEEAEDRVIFEQYTGLKDKNGKKIFEGDILKVQDPNWDVNEDTVHLVEWDQAATTYPFYADFGDYAVTSLGWAMEMDYQFEVIGNIHDNPELIQK